MPPPAVVAGSEVEASSGSEIGTGNSEAVTVAVHAVPGAVTTSTASRVPDLLVQDVAAKRTGEEDVAPVATTAHVRAPTSSLATAMARLYQQVSAAAPAVSVVAPASSSSVAPVVFTATEEEAKSAPVDAPVVIATTTTTEVKVELEDGRSSDEQLQRKSAVIEEITSTGITSAERVQNKKEEGLTATSSSTSTAPALNLQEKDRARPPASPTRGRQKTNTTTSNLTTAPKEPPQEETFRKMAMASASAKSSWKTGAPRNQPFPTISKGAVSTWANFRIQQQQGGGLFTGKPSKNIKNATTNSRTTVVVVNQHQNKTETTTHLVTSFSDSKSVFSANKATTPAAPPPGPAPPTRPLLQQEDFFPGSQDLLLNFANCGAGICGQAGRTTVNINTDLI
ncbi:unnamed protein product [Amoebophrya sp. A25]|nr:unnamed protein product [Amoebophrya sp. A25]|eukprot:GSA25T00017372001.1